MNFVQTVKSTRRVGKKQRQHPALTKMISADPLVMDSAEVRP